MADSKRNRDEFSERHRTAFGVRTVRRSRGMSKEELAEKAGYEGAAIISAIENLSKDAAYGKIKDIANALDVSIEQIKCYGRMPVSKRGWPVLTDNQSIALYLVAPMFDVLNDDEIRQIIDICLVYCKSKQKAPAWKQMDFQKGKVERKETPEQSADKQE